MECEKCRAAELDSGQVITPARKYVINLLSFYYSQGCEKSLCLRPR